MPLLRQTILNAIGDPNIALALLIVGALWIYAEFMAPGKVIPGMVGSVLILLGLKGLVLLPVAPAAVALTVLALVCLKLRGRVWAATGTFSFVMGTWKLVAGAEHAGRIHFVTAASLGVPFALLTSFLLSVAARARRNKTLDAKA